MGRTGLGQSGGGSTPTQLLGVGTLIHRGTEDQFPGRNKNDKRKKIRTPGGVEAPPTPHGVSGMSGQPWGRRRGDGGRLGRRSGALLVVRHRAAVLHGLDGQHVLRAQLVLREEVPLHVVGRGVGVVAGSGRTAP